MAINRREWLAGGIASATLAALPLEALAAGFDADYLRYVHPELRAAAAKMLQLAALDQPLTRTSLTAARQAGKVWVSPPRNDVAFEKRVIAGSRGQPEVTIFIVNAKPGGSRPAILHTHGGGYVLGTAFDGLKGLQDICAELDCVGVTVDYRLAPETTYAGSIEDNYAGLKWLYDHAAELGADPARVALLGESAGGGHAALLAITARDRREVPVAFQCLIYPMLDDRTGSSRAVPDHVGKIIWTAQKNRFGWESFLGQKPGGRSAPKGAVPARVSDLKGLPPTWIGVGTIDLFHDEDVDYAQRLNAAGVPTELIVVPGGFHGFDGIGVSPLLPKPAPISVWFNAAKMTALKRGLGLPL